MSNKITARGGFVGMTNDKIGYVRASVPTNKVTSVAGLSRVDAVDLDESVPLPTPAAEGKKSSGQTYPGPSKKTPDANPYMPTDETGSVDFKKKHEDWDGRGVTIGILDSGVDLDHPALQKTSTGQRKITDWVTATDPVFDGDGTWRAMLTEVTGPAFTYAGSTWTAPAGTYRINRFSESITAGSEPGGDVNRDGDTTDRFGILYDTATHDIWVDANQDQNFSADELMRPYNENYDVGHFGVDDPSTPLVERMPFVVQYREDVSLAPYQDPTLPATRRLREHRHRRGRARLARRRHRRGEQHVRREDGRPGPRSQHRLLPGLHLGRRLHRRRAHRRHGRPRRQPRCRRRQHVDRRPAGPQRRQQRPGRALRPDHLRVRGAAVHLRRQQRGGHQHHR